MTQERINSNNNTYAFVLEDPSKPRKYQLNFHLDHHQYKEPTHIQSTMEQQTLAPHLPHNPQHHSLHHIDRNPLPSRQPPQITLPPIRELLHQSPPPIPQQQPPPPLPLPPSQQQQPPSRMIPLQQQQQPQYLQNIHSQLKSDVQRPLLPPLETTQNYQSIFNSTDQFISILSNSTIFCKS
ncbi:15529_t:CDS:2 [Funneliformis caledonium]|uniref:15529_t:CDS:1 n=1 Tax=Funneliformis caledonium TaxID=1117310 RepID=A0A9N8V4Q6_9GLOM|nr:15529_t:CDS:2 [Funneliformis caledonium]